MTYMGRCCALFVVFMGLIVSPILAATSAKTLPQGVWAFDLYQENGDIEKAGVNPSNDGDTWETRKLQDATMNDLPLFQTLNTALGGALDLNTKLVDDWKIDKTHFAVAYGWTDALTLFASTSYDRSKIVFTDEYIAQTQIIDAAVGDQFEVAPKEMKTNHINDIYVGFKYGLSPQTSFTFRGTFGPLKIGKDDYAVTIKDGERDLPSGIVHDEFQFFINHDHEWILPWRLMAGYINKTRSFQNFLDNKDLHVDFGETVLLGIGTDVSVGKKIDTHWDVMYLASDQDKERINDEWVAISESDSTAIMGRVEVVYQPLIFLQLYANGTVPFYSDKQGKVYDVPGRLETGWVTQFGVRMFYK